MNNIELINWIHKQMVKGRSQFIKYQSFRKIGFDGVRDTDYRFEVYKLKDYTTKDSVVLDMGCATGFLSMQVAEFAKEVHGVEERDYLHNISNLVKTALEIDNCTFYNKHVMNHYPTIKYDVVLSLSVHHWSVDKCKQYFDKINQLLKVGGVFLFESHHFKNDEAYKYYQLLCETALGSKFEKISSTRFVAAKGKQDREFTWFRKIYHL